MIQEKFEKSEQTILVREQGQAYWGIKGDNFVETYHRKFTHFVAREDNYTCRHASSALQQ